MNSTENSSTKMENLFARIYNLLVEKCSAYDGDKNSFVSSYCKVEFRATEWRFQGVFGFGGKFWHTNGKFSVNCYCEEMTPKKKLLIEEVNALLVPFHKEYVLLAKEFPGLPCR